MSTLRRTRRLIRHGAVTRYSERSFEAAPSMPNFPTMRRTVASAIVQLMSPTSPGSSHRAMMIEMRNPLASGSAVAPKVHRYPRRRSVRMGYAIHDQPGTVVRGRRRSVGGLAVPEGRHAVSARGTGENPRRLIRIPAGSDPTRMFVRSQTVDRPLRVLAHGDAGDASTVVSSWMPPESVTTIRACRIALTKSR